MTRKMNAPLAIKTPLKPQFKVICEANDSLLKVISNRTVANDHIDPGLVVQSAFFCCLTSTYVIA